MRLNISDEFKAKILEGKAGFKPRKKGLKSGKYVKKANAIEIFIGKGNTVIRCYNKNLPIGDWSVPWEVDFQGGETLTIADIDLRLDFKLD